MCLMGPGRCRRCGRFRRRSLATCFPTGQSSWWWPATRPRRRRSLSLREIFPSIPFVGMEPAVKPAAENTLTGVVGVLATPATFQGALYASVVERFAAGVELVQEHLPRPG